MIALLLKQLATRFILKRLEKRMFKALLAKTSGKLTYGAIGTMAIGLVAKALGIEIAGPEVDAIMSAVAVVVAIYGRYRATKE